MNEQSLPDARYYQAPTITHRLAGLICTGYGSAAGTTERTEQISPGSHAVVHIYAGSGWMETAATAGRCAIEAGALVWLFPGVAHTLAPSPSGWSAQWALFDGFLAQSFELLGCLSRARPVVQPQAPAQVAALFAQLRADFAEGGPRAGLLGAALVHRLVVAHGTGGTVGLAQPAGAQALRRAVALIEACALQPLDLRAVAEECQIGYSTLRRHFREATGQSITEYVQSSRLRRARELLALTPMSVAEVASAVGFADPYYFSRLFHRKEGLTPTAFRRRHRH